MAALDAFLAVAFGKQSEQAQQVKIEIPRILMASFVFLSLTILTGLMSSNQYLSGFFDGVAEVTATVVTWLTCGILLLVNRIKK